MAAMSASRLLATPPRCSAFWHPPADSKSMAGPSSAKDRCVPGMILSPLSRSAIHHGPSGHATTTAKLLQALNLLSMFPGTAVRQVGTSMQRVHEWVGRKDRLAVEIEAVAHRTDGSSTPVKLTDCSDEGCRVEMVGDFEIG